MIRFFLRAKHWQLFLMIFILPFVCYVTIFTSLLNQQLDRILMQVLAFSMLYILLYYGWFYAVGAALFARLPLSMPMRLRRFKFCLGFLMAYTILMLAAIFYFMQQLHDGIVPNFRLLFFILPFHLLCIFCGFYCLYFVSRVLKAVELQRPVEFIEYVGEFFLIYFLPLGIWFIQPRINRIFDDTNMLDTTPADV